jgi:hypothetical protein
MTPVNRIVRTNGRTARFLGWLGREQWQRGVSGLEFALAAAFALCAVAAGTSALAAVLGAILG